MDSALLGDKLTSLAGYLEELESLLPDEEDAYLSDLRTRRAVERLIQLVVEAATDINSLLLLSIGKPVPESAYQSFLDVARAGALPEDIARRLAPLTGLRNRLTYSYNAVDDRVVYRAVGRAMDDLRAFCAHLRGASDSRR